MNKKRLVFLCSGNGGNLKFLHEIAAHLDVPYNVVGVIADRPCKAVEYARDKSMHYAVHTYTKSNQDEFNQALKSLKADIVITNIHKILSSTTLSIKATFINLHYSLLPDYDGLIGMATVDQAKRDGKKVLGATVHYVTEVLDGGEIIRQESFDVNWSDSLQTIYNKMFRVGAMVLFQSIMSLIGVKAHQFDDVPDEIWQAVK